MAGKTTLLLLFTTITYTINITYGGTANIITTITTNITITNGANPTTV